MLSTGIMENFSERVCNEIGCASLLRKSIYL